MDSGHLIFSYKITKTGEEEINNPSLSKNSGQPEEYSYIVTDRRIIELANPQSLSETDLEEIIKNKHVLFYTGAGLSRASNVPAMDELNELLSLEVDERFFFSFEKAIESPCFFAEKIKSFSDACLYSPPTPAHIALKELSLFNNTRIITENLDCLHESSGISPYRIEAEHLRSEIGGRALVDVDYIICIGLSFDDRGFLGWYKQQNPQGKIIAIDVKQPSYLGNEDFWISEDLQTLIPKMKAKQCPLGL